MKKTTKLENKENGLAAVITFGQNGAAYRVDYIDEDSGEQLAQNLFQKEADAIASAQRFIK